jgi:hypothetical protein
MTFLSWALMAFDVRMMTGLTQLTKSDISVQVGNIQLFIACHCSSALGWEPIKNTIKSAAT